MASVKHAARRFFDASETGKAWEACSQHCHPGATFSAQAGALANVSTLEGYADLMEGLFTPVPERPDEHLVGLRTIKSASWRGRGSITAPNFTLTQRVACGRGPGSIHGRDGREGRIGGPEER